MITETEAVHTRLLRFTLGVDECRAYWRSSADAPLDLDTAFAEYTFGQKSEKRVEVILWNMRARFDAFPPSLSSLRALDPDVQTARVICHWHTQLSDPMYRAFGVWLQERRERMARSVTRDEVVRWVEAQQPGRWSPVTQVGWASKLLSAAREAGLVEGTRDPRALTLPHVSDGALLYLLHLLRAVHVKGTLLDNAYLRSLGLDGGILLDRLRRLAGLRVQRMGDLVDLTFDAPDLDAWARESA